MFDVACANFNESLLLLQAQNVFNSCSFLQRYAFFMTIIYSSIIIDQWQATNYWFQQAVNTVANFHAAL